ncbi:MAG: NADH-quinone oxidoreductase subunit NuoK [Oceanicoccus sp.]|uniref:NADH-quinone oxidoreductase subunit NuoK n=1 Tax=Oceanicoccus sp. TaxID=2691044 RepID=UPI0026142812|nr:NADH-quinone oxidoreductase subunit NuoK [Oceanicoccus sp.]MCP3907775.1 NADH-quinone oxidoreductase subunit NuoK [Oceanicoccus sp.]
MVPLSWYISLSAILFIIGLCGALCRRNVLIVLMCLELMLSAVNINLVAFSYFLGNLGGQIFAIFVITITAAEVAVALAIVIALMRHKATLKIDELRIMKG